MFRTAPRGTHRVPGRAVVDYRGLVAPVGRSMSGVALGAVTAGVAVSGLGTAHAQAPAVASPAPTVRTPSAPATVAIPTVGSAPTVTTLRPGARGESVSALQEALNARGAGLRVDGSFGPATRAAVREFQRSAGLAVDGIAGPRTWAALGAPTGGGSRTASSSSSSSASPTLRRGANGDAVRTLQDLLRDRGASIPVTGTFASQTESAVRSFQRSAGLSVDGVVGPRTWSALRGGEGSAATSGESASSDKGSSSSARSSASGSAIVDGAADHLGTRYTWGGSSPSTGFDCSGLTRHVYAEQGISIPRTARQQALGGKIISRSQARPGDLVAFTDGNYGHIGIYAGDGMIIDASSSRKKVVRRAIWNAPHVFVTYR